MSSPRPYILDQYFQAGACAIRIPHAKPLALLEGSTGQLLTTGYISAWPARLRIFEQLTRGSFYTYRV
jgi:hypothetical protein